MHQGHGQKVFDELVKLFVYGTYLRLLLFSWVRSWVVVVGCRATASEHDQGDEVGDAVEAVGHADGDLDPVVEGLEPGVGVAQLNRAQDVRPAASDLLRRFDDLGYA